MFVAIRAGDDRVHQTVCRLHGPHSWRSPSGDEQLVARHSQGAHTLKCNNCTCTCRSSVVTDSWEAAVTLFFFPPWESFKKLCSKTKLMASKYTERAWSDFVYVKTLVITCVYLSVHEVSRRTHKPRLLPVLVSQYRVAGPSTVIPWEIKVRLKVVFFIITYQNCSMYHKPQGKLILWWSKRFSSAV